MQDSQNISSTPDNDLGTIDWQNTPAAVWRSRREYLKPIHILDPIRLEDLIGIDRQKQMICENTEAFLNGKKANNALLWGSRGTGKSSLIKSLLNQYQNQGLRVIEMEKDNLDWLMDILDSIRDQAFKYIIFIDDLSFESGDASYKALKSALEGSIEPPPDNVLFYATSNRRHLIPEQMSDNLESGLVEGTLHYADTIEEKISLSDRFGLWLSFYAIDQQTYLSMVDQLIPETKDREQLHILAVRFATNKGGRNGRTAKQFLNYLQTQSG